MKLLTRRSALIGAGAALAATRARAQFGAAPYWAFPGAYLDVDFGYLRYWGGYFINGGLTANATAGSVAASTDGSAVVYVPNNTGLLIQQVVSTTRWTRGMGMWAFAGFRNYCIQNRTLTNAAWVASNVTVAQNQLGADGRTNFAASLTATAANGTLLQAITVASAAFIGSCDVKRLSGSGSLSMTVDGGATWHVVSPTPTGSYQQVSIPLQTLANPTIGFQIANSGDSFAVDFVHCNNPLAGGSQLLNPARNITTTAEILVDNEEPTFNTTIGASRNNDGARIILNLFGRAAPWTGYIENSGIGALGCGNCVPDNGIGFPFGGCGGDAVVSGTGTTSNVGNLGVGNWNRIAVRVDASGSTFCLNGGPLAKGNVVPSSALATHLGIGDNGTGALAINGPTRRLTLWQYGQPDGFLQEITRLPA